MTRQQKNSIRAFILLMIFSANTVAGFACSIGVDMGYNKKHHHQPAASHSDKKDTSHKHQHDHSEQTNKQATNDQKEKDDCCGNDVTKFIQLDKSIAHNNLLLQSPVFLQAFVSEFILPVQAESNLLSTTGFGPLRRSWTLTDDTDLRIVIQSFQI